MFAMYKVHVAQVVVTSNGHSEKAVVGQGDSFIAQCEIFPAPVASIKDCYTHTHVLATHQVGKLAAWPICTESATAMAPFKHSLPCSS